MACLTSARALAGATGCMLLCFLVAISHAQEETSRQKDEVFTSMLARWNAMLDFPEALISDPDISSRTLEPLSKNIELVIRLAEKERKQATVARGRQRKLLDALGPPPAETDPPESSHITEQRAVLNAEVALYDARVKQTKVIIARAKALISQIGDVEVGLIAQILGKKSKSPLAPGAIAAGITQLPGRFLELGKSIKAWWQETRFTTGWGAIVTTVLVLTIGLAIIAITRRWLVDRHGMVAEIDSPSLARRFVAIIVETLARVVLPIVLISVMAYVVQSKTPLSSELETVLFVLVTSAIEFIIITGLARTALTSEQPQWRIVRFTNESAASLERAVVLFAVTLFLVNVTLVLINPIRHDLGSLHLLDFDTDNDSAVLVGMIGMLVGAVVSLNVLRAKNWRFYEKVESGEKAGEQPAPFSVRLLFGLARVAIVTGVVLYLIGYLNLGIYISGRTVVTLCFIGLALIIHGLVREGLRQATSAENRIGQWVRNRFALQDASAGRWIFWIVLLLDIILIVILVVLLLNTWGMPWTELKPLFTALVYGAEVGGHTFSLLNVAIALGAFVLLMLAIKLFQRFLSSRILVQTRLDVGVRDAVTAGVGYAGVVIAVLVALSLIGLKFGEIALIFSALSIGIGFGMQHVVNNFISGLILLVQRPIQAGDWIVVGLNQGYVKRINVISTEITTFDNATVIVPNSQLMTTEVMNWTHRGRLGRVVVPVGVAYTSDPEQVRDILLKCAKDHEDVLSRPAPSVVLREFGESSLDFQLRFFIRDIDYSVAIGSDVRFAIKKALDEAGIVIPFPQRDIHLKSGSTDMEQSPA